MRALISHRTFVRLKLYALPYTSNRTEAYTHRYKHDQFECEHQAVAFAVVLSVSHPSILVRSRTSSTRMCGREDARWCALSRKLKRSESSEHAGASILRV